MGIQKSGTEKWTLFRDRQQTRGRAAPPFLVLAVAFPKSRLENDPKPAQHSCSHQGVSRDVASGEAFGKWIPSPWASWKDKNEHTEFGWLSLGQSVLNALQPAPDEAFQLSCSSPPWECFQPNIWERGKKEPAGRCLNLYNTRREYLYPDNPSCTACISNQWV